MEGSESGKTTEIGGVKREDVGDSVSVHARGEPRIMYFDSRDRELNYDSPPFTIYSVAIWQKFHSGLYQRNLAVRVRYA